MESRLKYVFCGLVVLVLVLLGGVLLSLTVGLQEGYDDSAGEDLAPSGVPGVSVVAEGLYIPWGMAVLPNGDILTGERSGSIMRISKGENKRIHHVNTFSRYDEGLHGVALHPNFAKNRYFYVYYTYNKHINDEEMWNKVERYVYDGNQLIDRVTIIDGIPGRKWHNGGRMAFGPDGYLYVTTGDANNSHIGQDLQSLGGKVLRLRDDGSIPDDNPFGDSPVYSIGHRNPQGITWDADGNIWATEHGDVGFDEVNLIVAGGNYGYSESRGDVVQPGTIGPVAHSGEDTWAPSGIAFCKGSLFFGALRGQALVEAVLSGTSIVELKKHYHTEFGRIRSVVVADGTLYFTTSNRDRKGPVQGDPRDHGDDRILSIANYC